MVLAVQLVDECRRPVHVCLGKWPTRTHCNYFDHFMNRRDFLTSSLRGLVLGAAMSTGLARTVIAMPEPKFTEHDPHGRRGYVIGDFRPTKIIVNKAWLMAFGNG